MRNGWARKGYRGGTDGPLIVENVVGVRVDLLEDGQTIGQALSNGCGKLSALFFLDVVGGLLA